jgi:PAS domain S-box-containing protein
MALMTLVVAALVRSREREGSLLQAIIDRIPVMITMYETNSRVLRLNREFERLTGWSTEAARGVDLMERCYPDPAYRAEIRTYMSSMREGWRDVAMTNAMVASCRPRGRHPAPDDTRIGIRPGRDGAPAHRGRPMARGRRPRASRVGRVLFAMLGHELRNPSARSRPRCGVIDTGEPGDERSVQAREIVAGSAPSRPARGRLLDVTRLTTGKITLGRRPVDLAVVARRVVAAQAATTPTRHLRCEAGGSVWIDADETRLEQILTNLLGNAVKFTPAGGRVTVSIAARDGEAVLSVADTGAGIPADLLPRIFDLFVQGQTGLHRPAGGLGIGLTLVRRLVDLHSGRIEVASEGPGRGSVFTIGFPLRAAARDPADAAPVAGSVRVRRRVLIVEDHDDARDMLRHLLERAGHEVQAADGLAGSIWSLRLARRGGDRHRAAARQRRWLRRVSRRPAGMLLVAVTGWATGDRRRSRGRVRRHLTKPVIRSRSKPCWRTCRLPRREGRRLSLTMLSTSPRGPFRM